MAYNFKESKKRIIKILQDKTPIQEVETFPKEDSSNFSFKNGIRSWVGAIFIDIVSASELFKEEKDEKVARILRAYTSEIVDILNDDSSNVRQIGIRGDCVYAIYSAQYKEDLVDIFRRAYRINTMMKMFNILLKNNGFPQVEAGIGLGANKDLIIKAGKPQIMNDLVWIGDSVVDASNLSNIANRKGFGAIAINELFYENIIEELTNENEKYQIWIKRHKKDYYSSGIDFYHCDIIQTDFNDWIDQGMNM